MGLSTTISTAFFSLLLITGSAYLITMNIDLITSINEPLEEYLVNEHTRLGQDCEIDSWIMNSNHSVSINVTNTGAESIRIHDFTDFDLIISYSNAIGDYVTWVSYDLNSPFADHWAISQVYTNGKPGDAINPINLSGDPYGLWDPGETLELQVYIQVHVQTFHYLKLVMPYGAIKSVSLM